VAQLKEKTKKFHKYIEGKTEGEGQKKERSGFLTFSYDIFMKCSFPFYEHW
jgi:hypothetical protein